MQIKMIEGLHLTAANKHHIAEMLTKGIMEGGTKSIHYVFTSVDAGIARLTVSKKYSNDYGRVFWRKGEYVVSFI